MPQTFSSNSKDVRRTHAPTPTVPHHLDAASVLLRSVAPAAAVPLRPQPPRTSPNTREYRPATPSVFAASARIGGYSRTCGISGRRDSNSGPHRPESGVICPSFPRKCLETSGFADDRLVWWNLGFGGDLGGFRHWDRLTAQTPRGPANGSFGRCREMSSEESGRAPHRYHGGRRAIWPPVRSSRPESQCLAQLLAAGGVSRGSGPRRRRGGA